MNILKKEKASTLDKTTEEYKHFTNDVQAHRLPHWESIFHQARIPTALKDVHSVLEFGPGRGLLGNIIRFYGMDYYSADVQDWGAKPDFLKSIKDFDSSQTFDLVCAFQTLEHNPPEDFIPHLEKMASISNKYVYISLPYCGRWIHSNFSINLPKIDKSFSINVQWPRLFMKKRLIEAYRKSDTPYKYHWFEVGDKEFSKSKMQEHALQASLKVIETFHSKSFPYHYFMLLEKN